MEKPSRDPMPVIRVLSKWSAMIEAYDLRLGQLIGNIDKDGDMFYMENDDLAERLDKYLTELAKGTRS